MGGCCCRRRERPHGPLFVQMPEGVGRLDTWTCIEQVQRDVCELLKQHIRGCSDKSTSLFEWVAGPQLADWSDERRELLAQHISAYMLRKTQETGGFVLGAVDDDLQLAAVLFVSLSKGGRGPHKGCSLFDSSSHWLDPSALPWRKFKDAKNGIRSRARALNEMFDQHDRDMVGQHIFLRHYAWTPEADVTHFNKLMGVVTEYADRKLWQVYMQSSELSEVRAMEKHDFRLLEQVDFKAKHDPDSCHSFRGFSTMTRDPKPRKQTV